MAVVGLSENQLGGKEEGRLCGVSPTMAELFLRFFWKALMLADIAGGWERHFGIALAAGLALGLSIGWRWIGVALAVVAVGSELIQPLVGRTLDLADMSRTWRAPARGCGGTVLAELGPLGHRAAEGSGGGTETKQSA